jgi:hypothetical protein
VERLSGRDIFAYGSWAGDVSVSLNPTSAFESAASVGARLGGTGCKHPVERWRVASLSRGSGGYVVNGIERIRRRPFLVDLIEGFGGPVLVNVVFQPSIFLGLALGSHGLL